jgi:hypothetical protein
VEKKYCGDHRVQCKDAIGPPNIESLEIAWRFPRVQQDAANQETGKHEKEIHPAPGELAQGQQA